MTLRMKKLTLRIEREGDPAQKMNTHLRAKRKRKLVLIGLKAKRVVREIRMSSTASTKQRKKKSLAVAVEVEKRIGQKAERRPASTKVVTKESVQGAKKEIRKKTRLKQIRVKMEVKAGTL